MKRKPYKVCPDCGCSLDSGERCECELRREQTPTKPRSTKTIASQRRAYEQYLDERQREWLYS